MGSGGICTLNETLWQLCSVAKKPNVPAKRMSVKRGIYQVGNRRNSQVNRTGSQQQNLVSEGQAGQLIMRAGNGLIPVHILGESGSDQTES
jgi:hypothetical protein